MLKLNVDEIELFNEKTQEFEYIPKTELLLEHSLLSISKWEAKWHKSFFVKTNKNDEESVDYIRCMTINKNVDDRIYSYLSAKAVDEIEKYISDPMTATKITERPGQSNNNGSYMTSELIYYLMIKYGIPIEFERWHFNRLITLIRVFDIKEQPQKKMSPQSVMQRNAAMNAARRKMLHSKG